MISNDLNCHMWINAFSVFKCILQEEMAATDMMELLEQRGGGGGLTFSVLNYTPRSYYHCVMTIFFVNLTFTVNLSEEILRCQQFK